MRADGIVIRHASSGAVRLIADKVDCPVLNAGDGQHEHPTQGLLDALTIRRALRARGEIEETFSGLKVVICGDILHSRVARSNIHARRRQSWPSFLPASRRACSPRRKSRNSEWLSARPEAQFRGKPGRSGSAVAGSGPGSSGARGRIAGISLGARAAGALGGGLGGFAFCAFDLGNDDVPFTEWLDRTGKYHHTKISQQARGELRAVYEQVYNHYVVQMGLTSPYVQQAAEKLRPEGPGKPGADHPGYGTLYFTTTKEKKARVPGLAAWAGVSPSAAAGPAPSEPEAPLEDHP
ncbi:hypothetical protein [Acidovorax sp. BLS4]|uniref:hypothetical protein n=1 Tax=Acidovorax sp. BLS4 TaxID=3273430 RepID=UPI00355B4E66